MTEHNPLAQNEPDDPLDSLLQSARWPAPDEESLRRLRGEWRTLRTCTQRETARRRWWASVAVAAAIAAAVCAGWRMYSGRDRADHRIAPVERTPPAPREIVPDVEWSRAPSEVQVLPAEHVAAAEEEASRQAQRVGVRAPTPYERLLVRMVELQQVPRPAKPTRVEADPVDEAIAKVLADSDSNVSAAADALMQERDRNEARLLDRLARADTTEQRLIAQLLERLGSARSVPALVTLAQKPETHVAAVEALVALGDEATLASLARTERDPALEKRLIARLLARETAQGVALYLELFANLSTRSAALAALDEDESPPIDLLFAALNGGDTPQRAAAAVVLGRIDGPRVTERLVGQVVSHVNRQEALVALLASRGKDAREFVGAARRDQYLIAAVTSAQLELQRLFP